MKIKLIVLFLTFFLFQNAASAMEADSIRPKNRRILPYLDANFSLLLPSYHASVGLSGRYFGIGVGGSGGGSYSSSFSGFGLEGRVKIKPFLLTAEYGIAGDYNYVDDYEIKDHRIYYWRASASVRFLRVLNAGLTMSVTDFFQTYYPMPNGPSLYARHQAGAAGLFLGISFPSYRYKK